MLEKPDSIGFALATVAIFGQPPRPGPKRGIRNWHPKWGPSTLVGRNGPQGEFGEVPLGFLRGESRSRTAESSARSPAHIYRDYRSDRNCEPGGRGNVALCPAGVECGKSSFDTRVTGESRHNKALCRDAAYAGATEGEGCNPDFWRLHTHFRIRAIRSDASSGRPRLAINSTASRAR